jgi:Tfp pilus assembly protein PilW
MNRQRSAGFSLVELMIAMVLALVVIGAVITLVMSMMRANNQTIASTRLTQELRATAALIEADLRRSGGVVDPLTSATSNGGQPDTTLATIDTATAGCIQYSYANAEGGNFHSIFRSGNAIYMKTSATQANANCTAGSSDPALSSRQVNITGLTFTRTGRRIDVTLTGSLANAGRWVNEAGITRTYTQSVFVRSVAGT